MREDKIQAVIEEAVEQYLDWLADHMDNEDVWGAFMTMLSARRNRNKSKA